MISKKLIKFVFIIALALIAGKAVQAQGVAYGYSNAQWNSNTGRVTTLSATWLNYQAGLHYDPAVVGGMSMNGQLLGYTSDVGYGSWIDAVVQLQTNFSAPQDSLFSALSDHWIVAYFYTEVIILDDEYPYPGPYLTGKAPQNGPKPVKQPSVDGKRKVRRYYDPLGYSRSGGGNSPLWNDYQGSSNAATLGWEYEFFYLGSTWHSIIANPTSCEEPGKANGLPCATPTPTPQRTMQVNNDFKDGDLSVSATPHNALFGVAIELKPALSPAPTQTVVWEWTADTPVGPSCAVSQNCFAEIATPNNGDTFYTFTVKATHGSDAPITKTVKVKVSMPTISYTSTQRIPLVSGPGRPCTHMEQGLQFLGLGCIPESNDDKPTQIAKAGYYSKAVATPPAEPINNATRAWVEFRQLIKPEMYRWGNSVKEEFSFNSPATAGWREDFNGRQGSVGQQASGYTVRDRFANGVSGDDAKRTLDFIDSPSSGLANSNDTNPPKSLNKFYRTEDFDTYVTYYTASSSQNTGEENRHALSVIKWRWNGMAKKSGSTWNLTNPYSPTTPGNPAAEPIGFVQGDDGERAFSGHYRDAFNRIDGEWVTTTTNPPVSTTTKKNFAFFRPSTGVWHILMADGSTQAIQFGVSYDIPVPGDYDGDGRSDLAVYRPDNPNTPYNECDGSGAGCRWYILRSSDGNWDTHIFGAQEDHPVPADYDGDGKTDVAVYRGSTGEWWMIQSTTGNWDAPVFGGLDSRPMPSDYDGDGKDDLAVYNTRGAAWEVRRSSDLQIEDYAMEARGQPVVGDFDGDGKTDYANFSDTGVWRIRRSSDGTVTQTSFGYGSDLPIPGDFDGDGITDIAIWRSATPAQWWILRSSDGQAWCINYGEATDVPVPSAFWP